MPKEVSHVVPRMVVPNAHESISDESSHSDDTSSLKRIYRVETVLEMRESANGKREFLIQWKGWGPKWNNWEPEENIIARRLLRKFHKKKRSVEEAPPPSRSTGDVVLHSKCRCTKQAAMKARMAAMSEPEEDEEVNE